MLARWQPLGSEQGHARIDHGRAREHLNELAMPQAGAVGEGGDLDVETIARGVRAGLDDQVAARHLIAIDADEVEGHSPTRARDLYGGVVHVHRADAHLAPARLDQHTIALGDAAGPERARDDRADAVQREDAIDRQSHRRRRRACLDARSDLIEQGSQLVQAVTVSHRDLDDRRARIARLGKQLFDVCPGEQRSVLIDEVVLRQRDDRMLDAEQLEDRDVLARLRHHAVVARDHDQGEVDAARTGDHRAHESLVPGHVDDRQRAT